MENDRRRMMMIRMVDLVKENSSLQVNQGNLAVPPPLRTMIHEPPSENPMDPKKLNRLRINREASKRLREKKEEKVMRLEAECEFFENQVQIGVVGIENLNNQKQLLAIDNEQLKAQIISLEQYYELKQAEEMILRQERNELKNLHIRQIMQMLVQQKLQEDMLMMNAQVPPNQGDSSSGN